MGGDNDFYSEEEQGHTSSSSRQQFTRQSPFPTMPSPLFNNLAQSQFELLTHSLVHATATADDNINTSINININKPGTPKISSMALYLPKENPTSGQLEFVPAVTYPNQASERVFIASGVDSSNVGMPHQPPAVPSMGVLGLPGFFPAKELIPSYPFVSAASSSFDGGSGGGGGGGNNDGGGGGAGVGQEMFSTVSPDSPVSVSVVEEISLPNNGGTSLSVTLFSGLDTLGVLMIWPCKQQSSGSSDDSSQDYDDESQKYYWTSSDKLQVTRAAKSLALALSMDNERASTQLANEQFKVAMADSLHQVKSPLQALRTFGKLLQRQLAEENADGRKKNDNPVVRMERIPMTARRQQQALKLAEDMMSQGERMVDLIEPMDALVHENGGRYLLRGDIREEPRSRGGALSALILQPSSNSVRSNDNNARSFINATTTVQYQLPPSLPLLGKFELDMAYPQDVLGSIVYASQAISREKGINFDAVGFEPDNLDLPGVTVCQKYLKEAVSNLLDNAIKYAPCRRKGKVGRPRIPQIKVTLVSNEPPLSPGATLHIEDNGPGVPASEWAKVFERGYRGEDVQDDIEGSGLGLAIAREMITRMGGRIDLLEGDKNGGLNKLDGTAVRVILFRDPENAV